VTLKTKIILTYVLIWLGFITIDIIIQAKLKHKLVLFSFLN